jgi:integrase
MPPKVNFYLKKAEGDPPRSLVYLQMRYRGQKFVYSTGENIDPKDWNPRTQQARTRSGDPSNDKVSLNNLIATLREECLKAYNKEMGAGSVPPKEVFKSYLDAKMLKNVGGVDDSTRPSLFALINKFIAGKMGKRSLNTRKTYQTTKKHLENFQADESFQVTYDRIGLEFKNRFVAYLERERTVTNKSGKSVKAQGLSPNSIAKELKNIRTFMNMALEEGYTDNRRHLSKKFSVEKEATSAVYLKDHELRELFAYDFTHNKRLEAVRDLFVFNCYVGLRRSDATNIKPENIVMRPDGKTRIKITPQKTGKPVEIPCNDIVLAIFDKYKDSPSRLPPKISDQKYNAYLKELAKIAGLTETGRLLTDPTKPLYECITSHTARRSFATNCHLAEIDARTIMAVTGHKTEASFLLYLKHSAEENADRMEAHMERRTGRLKAV